MTKTKQMLLAGVALIAMTAPALAEELRGRVTETFGAHVTIEDRGARWLVRLPEGVAAPAEGARIRVEGQLDGRTLTAYSVTLEPEARARPDGRPGARDRDLERDADRASDRRRDRDHARDRDRPGPERRNAPGPIVLSGEVVAPALPGVSDLTMRHRSRSGDLHWSGRLGEGQVRIVSEWDGSVKRVESDGTPLPRPVLDRALPLRLSVLEGAERLVTVTSAERRPRGEIVLRGLDADGRQIEIKYDRRGRLDRTEFRAPLPGLDRSSVTGLLTTAGYTDIGWVSFGPRHVDVEADNAYGERVEVRINRDGQIDRERLLN